MLFGSLSKYDSPASEVKKSKSVKVDKKSTKVEKPKLKKKIVKSYKDEGKYWETDKLILRIFNDDDTHKDYIRTFMSDSVICINKDKIGKKTKYDNDKWGKIIDIKEDEKHLVFILEPILG